MKPVLLLLVAFTAAAVPAAAHAQWPAPGCPVPILPQAPDACGPGYYDVNCCGQVFGPNYCLVPPFLPFNGMIFARQAACYPGAGNGGAGAGAAAFPGFPTHPYARSPRDFFMME